MKTSQFYIVSFLCLTGCVSFPDKGAIDFKDTNDIKQLEGVYENKGDPKGYMSERIPNFIPMNSSKKYIKNNLIKYINVKVINEKVIVQAIKDNCIAYEKNYIYGTDFNFENGKIVLENDFNLLSRGPGDLTLGPSYSRTVIGIDSNGDGAYHNSGAIAVLVLLAVPVAAAGVDEIRFSKLVITKDTNFIQCLE